MRMYRQYLLLRPECPVDEEFQVIATFVLRPECPVDEEFQDVATFVVRIDTIILKYVLPSPSEIESHRYTLFMAFSHSTIRASAYPGRQNETI